SQRAAGDGYATCDACAKRFQVELVSSVFYSAGQRFYACSMSCRAQLGREASGVRLGEIAHEPAAVDAPSNARVMAVFNHKGGTGKTTTSVSVAAGLAMRGRRVLLVDTDAQGNVGVSLNVKVERSLYHVVVMGLSSTEAS